MARSDFLQALRAADDRIAAVAPGAHLEGRIRAIVRGAPLDTGAGRAPLFDRIRRPALAVLFVAVAAVAIFAGAADPGPARLPPQATDTQLPEHGPFQVEPDLASPPSNSAACADPRACHDGERRGTPIDRDGTTTDPRDPLRPTPLPPSPSFLREAPRPLLRDTHLPPDDAGQPLLRAPLDGPGASSAGRGFGASSSVPLLTYGGFNRPSEERSSPTARDLFGPYNGRSEPPRPDTSKPDAPRPTPPVSGGAPEEPVTCRPPDEWKNLAWKDCAEQGLEMIDLVFLDDCGDGTFASLHYVCAKPQEQANSGDVCTSGALGDGIQCEQPDYYKALATEICAKQGLPLTQIDFAFDCDGGASRYAKYLCCSEPAMDPGPPPACVETVLNAECISKDVLVEQATASCATMGMNLSSIASSKFCADGLISYPTLICCPPP